MTLVEFATMIDTSIELGVSAQWGASLRSVEIKDGCILSGCRGYGSTARNALLSLVEELRGKRIVIHAMSKEYRREYVVPTTLVVGDLH